MNQKLKKMIIYKLTNKIDGKIYIGQTLRSLDERMYWHIYSAKTGPTSFIHRAIRKYGIQSFDISVIDFADSKKILDEKEKYWISKLDAKAPNGYNMTEGGTGGSTNRGKPHSKETIKRMSKQKVGKGNPFFGKKHSEESKKKISKSLEGNKRAAGLKHTAEFKECKSKGWIGEKNPMKDPNVIAIRKMLKKLPAIISRESSGLIKQPETDEEVIYNG